MSSGEEGAIKKDDSVLKINKRNRVKRRDRERLQGPLSFEVKLTICLGHERLGGEAIDGKVEDIIPSRKWRMSSKTPYIERGLLEYENGQNDHQESLTTPRPEEEEVHRREKTTP